MATHVAEHQLPRICAPKICRRLFPPRSACLPKSDPLWAPRCSSRDFWLGRTGARRRALRGGPRRKIRGARLHDPTRARRSARHPARRGGHSRLRQSRLDRNAAHGRARRRAGHPLYPRPAGGDGGRHGRRLGPRLGPRRVRQPARDGGLGQRHGRAGRLQGERDAARRHRRPAGHPPSDDRAVAFRRSRRPRRAGDQMGEGAQARRGCRPGLAPRVRGLPHAAVRAGLPVAADGHPRPGGEPARRRGRPRRRASVPRPTRARLAEALAGLDPDRVVVLLGDDLPAAVERRIGRVRRGRRLSGLGNAAHFPHRLSVRAPLLGGGAEAGFRRHARPLQGVAGDRAGRRTRIRRLSLSRRRAGARGRRDPAYRRQPGGVRARTARRTWRSSATSD